MNTLTYNTLKKITGQRHSLPIIQNMVHVDWMGLTATNLDTYVHVERPTSWQVDGAGAISLDVVKSLIGASSVSIAFRGEACSICVDGRIINTTCRDSRDFPSTPENDGLTTSGKIIGQDIAGVLDFLSKDDLRPAMMGAYIGEHIVGTNGHIMRYRRSGFEGVPFILRREAVEAIKVQASTDKKCKGPAQFWHVEQGREYVALYRNDITILSRKIAETYPNYLSVIPQDNDKIMTVNIKELQGTIKNMASSYNPKTKQVVLEVDGAGKVAMSASDIDMGTSVSQALNTETSGFPSGFRIGYNAGYLDKISSNVYSDVMTFQISDPNRAAIINNEVLLMPVMLNV
jgi:DNA polymerase-3 subunit beta